MLWIHRFIASSLNLLVPFQLFAPAQHGVIYGLSELERYLPGRNFGIGVSDRHVQAAGHKKTDLPPQRLYKRPGQRSAASTQARWRAIQETHYATPRAVGAVVHRYSPRTVFGFWPGLFMEHPGPTAPLPLCGAERV
jgi:hypothetical protein